MRLIKPALLKKLVQHNKLVTFAMAMLNSRWDNVIAKYGVQTKIDLTVVITAKELSKSGLIHNQINFNDYGSVRKYLIQNDVYMSGSGRQEMLKPFHE